MDDYVPLRLTPEEERELEEIRKVARTEHERRRKAASARGRHDFPMLPFECSWAYLLKFVSALPRIRARTLQDIGRGMYPGAVTLKSHA